MTAANQPFCFLLPGFSSMHKNLLKDEWMVGSLTSHCRYLSRNDSASRQHSASQMDNPSFFTCSLVARDLCHLSGIAIPVKCSN